MRTMILATAAVAVFSLSLTDASAQTPAPAKKPAAERCRDAKGKMVKCTAKGAIPEGAAATGPEASAPAATTASKPSMLKGLFAKKTETAPTASASAPTAGQAPVSSVAANAPAPKAAKTKKASSGPKAPSASSTDPAGATAKCKDGSYWHGKSHAGSCSHHGGVASFL